MRTVRGCSILAAALLLSSTPAATPQARDAEPFDAISGILNAFRNHQIVALSDAHGNAQAHAFLLSLIRSPRFPSVVNDIVVEFGNARYQDVMDRFTRGENVPYEQLRAVWRDTTQPSAANDLPHAEEVFRAVRDLNAPLPRDHQLRVLLGDPPIDWSQVTTREDHFTWIELRDSYPASLIQVEVIAKRRRALVVYGHGHFQRRNVASNFDMSDWRAQTIVSLIESAGPTRVFTIWRDADVAKVQPSAASWKAPSIAILRGTVLGAADASQYLSWPRRMAVKDGKIVNVPTEEWRQLPAEDQLDAVLYLGKSEGETQARWSPKLCADAEYTEDAAGAHRARRPAIGGRAAQGILRVDRQVNSVLSDREVDRERRQEQPHEGHQQDEPVL